ncbi:hypothetical protein DEFR109230_04230 [Deinococcus frigens]
MGRTVGRAQAQAAAQVQRARRRVDARDLQRLGAGQRRQQPRRAAGQHGLAAARRTDEQQVVPPRQRDFQRPPRRRLTFQVCQVQVQSSVVLRLGRRRGWDFGPSAEMCHGLQQRPRAVDGQAVDQSGLARIALGQQGGQVQRGRQQRQIDRPGDGPQAAVQRQFPRRQQAVQRPRGQQVLGRQHAQRDGQVIQRSLLTQVRRGQIDRDARRRKGQPGVANRRPHPLARLADRLIGQADNCKGRQTGRHVHLDFNWHGVHADQCHAAGAGQHQDCPAQS